jgi:hypothetical protein
LSGDTPEPDPGQQQKPQGDDQPALHVTASSS